MSFHPPAGDPGTGAPDDGNSVTKFPGSTLPIIGGTNGGGTTSAPQPKPIEQVQVGDKFYVPGHPLRRTVQSITTNADTSLTFTLGTDPDDDPMAAGYTETQQIERLHDAYLDGQHTGAKDVKLGLEAYKAVAEFYAYGPLYDLGGQLLVAAGSKAVTLSGLALKSAAGAAKSGALAAKFKLMAVGIRKAVESGHTAEEIAQAGQKAAELDKDAAQLEAAANEAQSLATQGEKLSRNTTIVQEAFQNVPEGARFKANTAFGDNSRLAEMTLEEREAVAQAFVRISSQTGNKLQEATRLYSA